MPEMGTRVLGFGLESDSKSITHNHIEFTRNHPMECAALSRLNSNQWCNVNVNVHIYSAETHKSLPHSRHCASSGLGCILMSLVKWGVKNMKKISVKRSILGYVCVAGWAPFVTRFVTWTEHATIWGTNEILSKLDAASWHNLNSRRNS
jgi:hypothetical protein